MTMKMTLAAALVALPGIACAQGTAASGQPQNGTQFLQQVARESVNEMREALVAEMQAHDPAVRAYARLMIEDHTILTSELAAVSGSGGFNMSSVQNSSDEGTDLKGMSGTQFDRAFIDHEVTQHRQSVQHWEQAERALKGDQTAESFAKLGLPLQQEHLALAEAIQARLPK